MLQQLLRLLSSCFSLFYHSSIFIKERVFLYTSQWCVFSYFCFFFFPLSLTFLLFLTFLIFNMTLPHKFVVKQTTVKTAELKTDFKYFVFFLLHTLQTSCLSNFCSRIIYSVFIFSLKGYYEKYFMEIWLCYAQDLLWNTNSSHHMRTRTVT